MALINHAKREINAKIVYYGPEGGGKRNSLQYVYDRIKPSLRGELKAPTASGDSLFFFDFSPFENPVFGDYRLRFHVYTLPGKVANPAAWKMTLKGADGLVLVADASPELAAVTRECVSDLRGFLSAYGVGFHDVPSVLQLNKRNNPQNLTAAELATALDLPQVQACLADAVSGEGVLDVLSLLSRQIMTRIGQDDALQIIAADVAAACNEDAEASATLASPAIKTDQPVNGLLQVAEEKPLAPLAAQESGAGPLQVMLTGAGASCADGVVRVPLEFTLGGATRRVVVSIAIDQQ